MFQTKTYFCPVSEGGFPSGEAAENQEDEALIVADQDETVAGDRVMGGMGTKDVSPAATDEFERGEIDIVDQMRRATRVMDHATHRDQVDEDKRNSDDD